MSSLDARITCFFVALLVGCDPNVVVGYAVQTPMQVGSTADAAMRDADASKDASPTDAAPVRADAAPQDAAQDAGPPPPPAITWSSGAHAGNDLQVYLDFGVWRGRALDIAAVYPDRNSWAGVVTPGWPVDLFATFPGKLVMSEPLYPEGMGNNQDCAAGMYDAEWQKLGTFLVDRGRPDTILRLGWGFNDTTHPWKADADLTDWLSCFRRIVSAVRSTNDQVQIDWSFNALGAAYVAAGDPYLAYPGDGYVDYVGIEAFDDYPATLDAAGWDEKCKGQTGLCTLMDFARAHGKKVGIAEWGLVSCAPEGGGDNPFFVRKMVEAFAANADIMGYEAYFEDGGSDLCSDISDDMTSPAAAAEYRKLYGLP